MSALPNSGPAARDRWIGAFTALYLEVEAGLRPMRHIRPLLEPQLQIRLGGGGRRGPLPHIGRIVAQQHGCTAEAVVLLDGPARTTALVLALRRADGRWRVAEVGRPGETAPPPADGDPTDLPPATVGWCDVAADDPPRPAWQRPEGWRRDRAGGSGPARRAA